MWSDLDRRGCTVLVQPLERALATGGHRAPLSRSLVGLDNYRVPGLLYFNGFVGHGVTFLDR